jgi:antitoxin component YwqK of YwqJK toxin-antitoxin module
MIKQLLILLTFSFVCQGQTRIPEGFQDINYKDVTEIKNLIYSKADTSLVTGKVIRFNKKNEAKSYILVTNGKPDILGWVQISDRYERPKESVLGEVVKGTAFVTGAVMAATGNDVNIPYRNNNLESSGKELESFHNAQKDNIQEAYDKMADRNDISKDLNSMNNERNETEDKFSIDDQIEIDKKKNGEWEEYYNNGQLRTKGNYIEGKKDGTWHEFYENGQLSSKSNYVQGKKEHLLELYHSNGHLKGRINYKEGKEDGMIEVFYENGNLMINGSNRDGKQIGEWNYYNEKGVLLKTENYDN